MNITESLNRIRVLDELAEKRSIIHDIHPLIKVLTTLIYLITVISFSKYQISGLLPYIFYPVIVIALSDIPYSLLFKRALIALPLILGVGILNPILDRDILVVLPWINISGGWISFISLVIRGMLTILAVLILVSTTGMTRIAEALQRLRVPKVFIMQLLFTYRYIFVLIEEASRMVRGYSLRSPDQRGVSLVHIGPILGQMLLRTLERAQRIYQAMCCRGFQGEYKSGIERKLSAGDVIYLVLWSIYFMFMRYSNITGKIGVFMTGVIR